MLGHLSNPLHRLGLVEAESKMGRKDLETLQGVIAQMTKNTQQTGVSLDQLSHMDDKKDKEIRVKKGELRHEFNQLRHYCGILKGCRLALPSKPAEHEPFKSKKGTRFDELVDAIERKLRVM